MEEFVIRNPGDIEKYIDDHPIDRKTLLLTFVALGGTFVDAYDFSSLGVGVVQMRQTFHLSPFQVGLLTAIMALGACAGAISGGSAIDRLGRFKILLVNVTLLVVAALGAALSTNIVMLLAFRLLIGIGVGLDFPVALSYVAEIVSSRTRSGSVATWQIMWYVAAVCSGLVILPLIGTGLSQNLWRIAIGFGAVPALIILLLRYFYIDESPRWAARNLSLERAGHIVAHTYGINVRIVPDRVAPKAARAAQFSTLFYRTYLPRTVLVSAVCITQAVEYFSVGFNVPSISQAIFGNTIRNAILGAVFFNLFGIVGASVGAFFNERVSIRKMVMLGFCIVAVSLVAFGLTYESSTPALKAALLASVLFGHSLGPGQGMTFATLSYPTAVRGLGSGWGQGMIRVGSICGFFLFPLIVATAGMGMTLLYVAIVPVLGLASCLAIKWDPRDEMSVQEPDTAAKRSTI